jgi:hypothetical protein
VYSTKRTIIKLDFYFFIFLILFTVLLDSGPDEKIACVRPAAPNQTTSLIYQLRGGKCMMSLFVHRLFAWIDGVFCSNKKAWIANLDLASS